MEPDGVTRIYLTRNTMQKEAWLVYPTLTPFRQRLTGEKAKQVLRRGDFHAGSVSTSGESYWIVRTTPKDKPFEIDSTGDEYTTRYATLAHKLEEKSRRNGLTIIVS